MKLTHTRRNLFKVITGAVCASALPSLNALPLASEPPRRKYVSLATRRLSLDSPLQYRWLYDGRLVGPIFTDLKEAFRDVEFKSWHNEMILINGEWVLDKNPKPKFAALVDGKYVIVSRE